MCFNWKIKWLLQGWQLYHSINNWPVDLLPETNQHLHEVQWHTTLWIELIYLQTYLLGETDVRNIQIIPYLFNSSYYFHF